MNSIFLTGEKTFIKDLIHNHIELSPIAKTIIDTPIFQRLRYLNQLGVSYLIFPNAKHSRFEHSIGTYHLTGILLEKLIKNSNKLEINNALVEVKFIREYLLKHLEMENNDNNISFIKNLNVELLDDYLIELIKIAGLIHDIGHGPFSHLFDEWIHSLNLNNEMLDSLMLEHESRSILLFKEIIKDRKIKFCDEEFFMHDFIDENAFEFISELINPKPSTPNNNFIFQIISNSLNGLDVDKLDYLLRDSNFLGEGEPFKLSTIISHVQVINKNMCFPKEIAYYIFQVFRSRYDLHKKYYTNSTTISIEYMIKDVLYNLDSILKISNTIKNNDVKKFIELTDSTILETAKILKWDLTTYKKYEKQIDYIQKILDKLNNREIYKCLYTETFKINENISKEQIFNNFKQQNEKNINFKCLNIDNIDLNFNSPRFKIKKIKIGLLSGEKSHPLDSIYFYDQNKSFILDKTKITFMTTFHQEIIYYIIYKNL